jgi:hypothetical protein
MLAPIPQAVRILYGNDSNDAAICDGICQDDFLLPAPRWQRANQPESSSPAFEKRNY